MAKADKLVVGTVVKVLKGAVDNQENTAAVEDNKPAPLAAETIEEATKRFNPKGIAEVEILSGTFRITAKDEDKKELYANDKEPFYFPKVPSLSTALKLYGAELSTDQEQFLEEALKGGESTGKAVKELLEVINGDLEASASKARYQKVLNHYTPLTEENITNAHASMVRNFMKTQNLTDEVAIATLQSFGVVPKEFTLEVFRANKGKR